LAPDTSHDLNKFVAHKLEELDIDLPGPDFLTSLCVDEDEIEKNIRKGVAGLVGGFQGKIKAEVIDEIVAKTGQPKPVVQAFFDSTVSLTFKTVRFPVVEHKQMGPLTFDFRAVVMDPCLGFPRKLF
jgi:hypothetical protein